MNTFTAPQRDRFFTHFHFTHRVPTLFSVYQAILSCHACQSMITNYITRIHDHIHPRHTPQLQSTIQSYGQFLTTIQLFYTHLSFLITPTPSEVPTQPATHSFSFFMSLSYTSTALYCLVLFCLLQCMYMYMSPLTFSSHEDMRPQRGGLC